MIEKHGVTIFLGKRILNVFHLVYCISPAGLMLHNLPSASASMQSCYKSTLLYRATIKLSTPAEYINTIFI